MAIEDDGAHGRRALAAVLFMQAGMTVMDTYSTLNSSPWTTENVGADAAKMASLQEYITHAAVFSTAWCVMSAIVAGSVWPIVGAVGTNAYLVWIYHRAMNRGKSAGSAGEGWFDGWSGNA